MGKFFKGGFKRRDLQKIQETKIENMPKRIITRIISSCVECYVLKTIRLQDEKFLIQCGAMNPDVFLTSSPALLAEMFTKCTVHPLDAVDPVSEPEKPVDNNVQ